MHDAVEMRLLTRCLPAAEVAPFAALIEAESVNWDRLLALAGFHGLAPMLTASFFRTDTLPPPRVLEALRVRQGAYLTWTLTHLSALVELQREFDRKHMRVVAWKGPSLGLLLYGSATLREWGDLDFLFLEEDLSALLETTSRLGYELQESRQPPHSRDLYLLSRKREFTFLRSRDQVVLEFHLQILPARFSLWQGSRSHIDRASTPCPLASVNLLVERPADLLLSLCAHATKHHWDRLKWSADIAQFLAKYGESLDWEVLLEGWSSQNKHHVVLLGLHLARKVFRVPLPLAVETWLHRRPALAQLASELAGHLMSGSFEPAPQAIRKELAALLCPRRRDRILYDLTPLVELNYEDLYVPVQHRPLFFLNYVFRVFRLLRKYGPQRLATKTAGSVRSVH